MAKGTIRGIHAILSGAFEAAMRWEWTDRNPAASARPPTPRRQTILATSPEDVAKVIAEARARSAALGLYLWLVQCGLSSMATMLSGYRFVSCPEVITAGPTGRRPVGADLRVTLGAGPSRPCKSLAYPGLPTRSGPASS